MDKAQLEQLIDEAQREALRIEYNNRRLREESEKMSYKATSQELNMAGGAAGGAVGGIIGLFFILVGFALIILFFILKYLFIFLIFLRNRFFIKWNWYVKTENAIKKCLLFIREIIIWIIALPFIILIRHFDLCVVAGAISLYCLYGK